MGAPVATDAVTAWRTFVRAHAALHRRLDTQLETGHRLSLAGYGVLRELADAPGGRIRMNELAEAVMLSRSGLTRLVDRLSRDGLVGRESCASDARGTYAVITEEGRRRLAAAAATHLAGVRDGVASRFSAAELADLVRLLSRFVDGGNPVA